MSVALWLRAYLNFILLNWTYANSRAVVTLICGFHSNQIIIFIIITYSKLITSWLFEWAWLEGDGLTSELKNRDVKLLTSCKSADTSQTTSVLYLSIIEFLKMNLIFLISTVASLDLSELFKVVNLLDKFGVGQETINEHTHKLRNFELLDVQLVQL